MNNFKNIYIEKEAYKHKSTFEIIEKLPRTNIIEIDHYKDVFCRPRQNVLLQKEHQNLILAVKQGDFVYPGAGVCQDFGYDNFYYSSCVMNCVCNCEYCFLKGMYPSGHVVAFVNLEDYFEQLNGQKMYICVSFDTDLFPLEETFGYIAKWCDFARNNPQITLEIRTKFKNDKVWKMPALQNVIFAFSLSPQEIIDQYEHKTSSLEARIENICSAQDNGFRTRLCFDPIIYEKEWRAMYSQLVDKCFERIDPAKLKDISVGSFRISQSYLKNMRKIDYTNKIVNYPFVNINGYYQYRSELQAKMENFVLREINKHFDTKKVFLWK